MENLTQLLTPAHVAALLGVKRQTLALWRHYGRIDLPYVKVGSRVMYDAAEVAAWLESRTRRHTADKGPTPVRRQSRARTSTGDRGAR